MNETKTDKREQKIHAMRVREQRARRKRITIISSAVVAGVLAIGIGAVALVNNEQGRQVQALAGGTPSTVTNINSGYTLPGTPKAGAPTLQIWEDFQCPACESFESTYGTQVEELASSGQAKVDINVLHFLDANLGNDASYRAAMGAAAAAEQGRFAQYHRVVYSNPPASEGVGFTDEQLSDFARQAGVPDMDKWTKEFTAEKYRPYIKTTEDRMAAAGVSGTPAVFLDGNPLDLSTLGQNGLSGAVAAATK